MSRIDVGYRNIARISTPVALSYVSFTAMGILDTIMVGRLGVTALAGVGLGHIITWWILSAFWGMIAGVNTEVAQAAGADDRTRASNAFWQGLYLGAACATVMLALWPLAPSLFALTGAPHSVQQIASDYMQVRLLGGGGLMAMMVADNVYRGLGQTQIPMWCGFLKLAVNCGVNYVFIFGAFGMPAFGPVGAAVGTVIANWMIGALMIGLLLVLPEYRDRHDMGRYRPFDRAVFRALFALSWPLGVQTFMEMGGITVFTAVIGQLGEVQLAATNAVIQAWSVAFTIGFALSVGATTLVGQSLGARAPHDARVATQRILRVAYATMTLLAVMYLGYPEWLMSVFVERGSVAALTPLARPLFSVVALCLFIDTTMMVYWGALRGAGDTRFCMYVNVGSAWLVFVPLTLVVAPRLGVVGAWCCLFVHLTLTAIAYVWRFRGTRWHATARAGAEPALAGTA